MSIFSSGMWCDLCRKPILSGKWWNIEFKRKNGDNKKGHSCGDCKKKYDKNKTQEQYPPQKEET